MKISLSQPDITQGEQKAVLEVLKTPYLALGPKLKEFEERFAAYIGTKYAIAVNSGTSGLHLVVRALGIGERDEVITTPFSFIASANCILFERAKPVFVDIDPETMNIDPDRIEGVLTKKTKAILAVDIFGHPADWDSLIKIAKKHDLLLIEDACEAIGARYKSKYGGWEIVGSFGQAAVFAFYPNKQITTGEGGMIVTNDKRIANLCRSMTNQGRKIEGGKWLEHVRLGYNYRMSEVNATLGVAQLSRIEEILSKREEVAQKYNKLLEGVPEVEPLSTAPYAKRSWFVYVVQLSRRYSKADRDDIMEKLRSKGVQCSDYFRPIHLQPFYKENFGYKRGDFPVCEGISDRTIALPFYNNLTDEDMKYVINFFKEVIK